MSRIVETEDITALVTAIDNAEKQWGTAFDDSNNLNDWVTYVGIYTSRAAAIENKRRTDIQYDALIKAAGLALTAAARIRQDTVQPRHYDEWPSRTKT